MIPAWCEFMADTASCTIMHYGWGLQTDELRWFMDLW